jgi:transcriptional regulator with XRE-family HTH domain
MENARTSAICLKLSRKLYYLFYFRTYLCLAFKQLLALFSNLTIKYANSMSIKLSQKQIGQRIAGLRKIKGYSQEELAKNVGISRSSLAQIELGNRSIDIMEVQNLSIVLGFSLDEFMSVDFAVSQDVEGKAETGTQKVNERISLPSLQVNKFKNVILYILERCAGKPNVGETVIYKLLYFSDYNYYELYEEHLTGAKYRKLPYGPVPQKFDVIINQMIDTGQIQRVKTEYHGYRQTRFLPLIKANLTELKASEKEIIDRVIEQMSDWSAAAISNYSHNDMPWVASKEGEEINYELAFYRAAPYSVRNYENEIEEQ